MVLPSFCILLLISAFYDRFAALRPVEYAFRGIRAAVPALLLRALWTTFRKCPKDLPSLLLLAAAFLLTVWGILPAFLLPIGFALSGILLLFLKRRRTK